MKNLPLFSNNKIDIIPLKYFDFNNGMIFYVKNGKGLLRLKYGSLADQSLCALMFDDIPLLKFHGDEYFCPTCEKLISAGYGLCHSDNKTIEELGAVFNAPFVSITQSFEALKPLLGLLPTGYYTLSDEELYPTDGQGNFFWNVSNTPTRNRATCPIYDPQNSHWSSPLPRYIFPTQSPRLYNESRVEYYRTPHNSRAIAYYFNEGYLCALLDGHHKACAAALNAAPLKALVISGASCLSFPHEANGMKASIIFKNAVLFEEEMLDSFDVTRKQWAMGTGMNDNEVARCLALKNDDFNYVWPPEILQTANNYFDVYSLAYLEWADAWAETWADDPLNKILAQPEPFDSSIIYTIAHALYITKNPHFLEFAFFFGKDESFVDIWPALFKLLANIKNQPVEDFFVDFLVNDERLRPNITKIVDDYFAVG